MRIKRYLIILTVFIVTILSSYSATYDIENLKIIAQIQNDGSVDIEEYVEYDAYNINGILYNIDYLGYGELENLQVYYEDRGKFIPAIKNNNQKRGTYELKESHDKLLNIKLYFPLRRKSKYFLFKYTLTEGITVYKDIAQFNRKLVGKGWDNDISNIEIKILLPEEIDKNKIYAFGHGQLTGNIDILNGKEVELTLKNYLAGEFVEANILFPREIVPNINPKLIKNENGFEKIMKLEKKLATQANIQRFLVKNRKIIGNILFYIWGAWLIFTPIFAYIKNGKKYKVKNEYGEYFRDLPDNSSPAVAGAIITYRVQPQQLLATVMDLVRRNIFEMIEDRASNKTYLKLNSYDSKKLKNYENFLVKLYIEDIGDGEKVAMEDIDTYIASKKNSLDFGRKYEKWEKMVNKELNSIGFVKEKPQKLPIALGVINLFLSIPLTVLAIVYFEEGRFIFTSFITFISLPFIINRRRYTLEAEKLRCRWLAFKNFLVDYSNLEEAKLTAINIWEHYFVYAIALGVAEKVAKGYNKIFNVDLENSSFHNRTSLMRMYGSSRAFSTIERTTLNSVSHSMSVLSQSRRSSSSGRGGGFSRGSSGGGGSRGGGGAF